MVGADHRVVLPASALFGAAFLVGCDVLSRTLMAPLELPVGIITALIGGPFFLWLLIRRPEFAADSRVDAWLPASAEGCVGAKSHGSAPRLKPEPRDGRLSRNSRLRSAIAAAALLIAAAASRSEAPAGQQTDARGAGADHLARPRGHRDAVRGRRGSAGRRRQQLRPFPAGGRAPASSGGAARSRRRADPLAAAGSGRRLSQPDRRPGAARTAQESPRSCTRTPGWRTSR